MTLTDIELYDDIYIYEMGEIVLYGQLTPYGETVYEQLNEIRVYDEIDGRWINV